MDKHVVGFSMNVSPGRVLVGGKEVEVESSSLVIGVDKYGQWHLSSVEATLSWWRRALIRIAYRPLGHKREVPQSPVTYVEYDYDDR